ncbi:MAG: protein-glutamate O-methyltransferase CheR [Firmicutes bacterium]|nr:protein-glutamate O-methyltransferase CheR [Bacillota bacterium]
MILEDTSYSLLRKRVLDVTGIDIACYKPQQMERRLKALLDRSKVEDYYAYARMIEHDPEKARELWDFITINVSEFFRNPDRYKDLKEKIIPSVSTGRPLRIWSAGCANGAEPYSLAILLHETGNPGHTVLATDIDRKTLTRAQAALYDQNDLKNVGPARIQYFEARDGKYAVSNTIKKYVTFQYHDLLGNHYPEGMDIIVCRNVVIYFTEEAKERVFRGFCKSLKPGGVLFVGETETLFNPKIIGFEPVLPFFYRRAG